MVSNFQMSYSIHWNFTFDCKVDEGDECKPHLINLASGVYLLKAWGASGGYYDSNHAGKGGYAQCIITLKRATKMYVFVGEAGSISSNEKKSPRAWNGGGSCDPGVGANSICGSGGGATDFRIDSKDLVYRVLVAGGGGGSGYSSTYSTATKGGAGGGIEGTDGEKLKTGHGGSKATQASNGHWGDGQDSDADGCGGGGGYFGGGSGNYFNSGGGGGSGFTFSERNAEDARNNGIVLGNQYYLFEPKLIQGTQSMPDPNSLDAEMKGNLGNGYARIIQISLINENFCTNKSFFSLISNSFLELFISVFIVS